MKVLFYQIHTPNGAIISRAEHTMSANEGENSFPQTGIVIPDPTEDLKGLGPLVGPKFPVFFMLPGKYPRLTVIRLTESWTTHFTI